MFDKILEIKSIRAQKSALSERETELSRPILSDLNLIPDIHKWFSEILEKSDVPPRLDGPNSVRKFIFIILLIYSPAVLAGDRMPSGLRERIASVFKLRSHTSISHNIENVIFLYQNYKDFRRDIDYLYAEIISRLKVEELIK